MWTCCECENHYDSNTGDTDERMCHECLDAQYEGWTEESKIKKEKDEKWREFQTVIDAGMLKEFK